MDREHRALRPRELLASVSPVEAEQPEEVGGIDEDLPSVTEASWRPRSHHPAAVSGKSHVVT
jgi:hypothetical protein